jgi:hypothetical protein
MADDLPIFYANQVGGQDELVFDGGSMLVHRGEVLVRLPRFTEAVETIRFDLATGSATSDSRPGQPLVAPTPPQPEAIWEALCLGTRDYVVKNGFSEVVVGLSGGVDSALVAAIATDALGPEKVHVVLMPSRYSSDHSVSDAEELAANLGVDRRSIPIEDGHRAFLEMLAPSFAGTEPDLTEENLQSRIRGMC